MKFDEFMDMNPRKFLIKGEFKDFYEFAKQKYCMFDHVNFTHYEDAEEFIEEVESYLNDSMEAILLFIEYMKKKEQKQE